MQRTALLAALKRALKAAGVTYAEVASQLDLSEASVKRIFHQEDMSLSRVESIAEIAGLSLAELVESLHAATPLVSELTADQEDELIADAKLLLFAYLLPNGADPDDIVARYQIEPDEKWPLLRRLRDLGLIEILPFDRIRVLTARNFHWRPNGPVQKRFLDFIERDFFDSRFAGDDAAIYLLGAVLSPASRRQVARSMQRLAIEIDELSRQDSRLSRDERQPSGAVLAVRQWELEAFARLRREEGA